MSDLIVRAMKPSDLPDVIRVWNECVDAGEVLYYPLTEAYFERKFVQGDGCESDHLLIAEKENQAIGFLHGVAPGSFVGARPGCAYLTCVLVDRRYRLSGVGSALLEEFKRRMKGRGAEKLYISSLNPVNLDWRIPGTPGHDHNNMPGADAECAGYPFLERVGFEVLYREIAMYMEVGGFRASPKIAETRERLKEQGIYTGVYDPSRNCGFDRMCDRVGSEYWRDALRTEIAAWRSGEPNADPRFWADGIRPRGPRTILAAVHDGEIVGFTGPVDLQKSGRGWFTGICTDPDYERRGIGTVLFHLLMEAFAREGAAFSTLFTGLDNRAQRIYAGAGMRVARQFHLMAMTL